MSKLKNIDDSKMMVEIAKTEMQIRELFRKVTELFMGFYVLFYLCIFPLCMRNKYFDVLIFHFDLFWKPTLVYGIIFLILGILYIFCDNLYNRGNIRRSFLEKIRKNKEALGNDINQTNVTTNVKTILKNLSDLFYITSVDIAITVLILFLILSTVFAEYPYEAFWGDRGRNQGLLIWLMFYLMYWLVTRFYKFKKWHIWAYMFFASLVCIWGISNFFLNTYGMFENADDLFKYSFVSSIGNINTYTGFTGMLIAVSAGLFISGEKIVTAIYAYIIMTIACFAHIMGLSDNAILSIGIIFAAAPILICENCERIAKYFIAVATYIGAMKITSLIALSGIGTMNDPDPSVQITIGGKGFVIPIIIVALILAIGFMILHIRLKTLSNDGFARTFKKIWWGLIIAVAIAIISVVIMANSGIHIEGLEPYSNLLIFNDTWGTGRGLIWRLGVEYWLSDTSLFVKLFGYGPDTFYIITMDRFMNIMQDAGYGMFDSAHNEYFEYFLTIGIIGLIAYLTMLIASLRTMFNDGDYSKILGLAVLAYAFQAVVNIAVPITTPVFMLLMYVGVVSTKEKIVRKS